MIPLLSRLEKSEHIMSACSLDNDLNDIEYLLVTLLYVRLKRQVLIISIDFMIVRSESRRLFTLCKSLFHLDNQPSRLQKMSESCEEVYQINQRIEILDITIFSTIRLKDRTKELIFSIQIYILYIVRPFYRVITRRIFNFTKISIKGF